MLLTKYLFYWFLDYVYVIRQEITTILTRRSTESYRVLGGVPVVLIPGVYENWRFLEPIAKVLHSHGYDIHVVAALGYNSGTVEDMAEIVREYIAKNDLKNVTIVSHSKGGLIGKYLLTTVDDPTILKKLVALNAPFSGSRYAYILPFRSLRIFIPTSKILTRLTLDFRSNNKIISIYGKFDPHIPGSSRLDGAKNIQLNTYGHFRVLGDPRVHAAVLESLHLSLGPILVPN